MSVETSPVIVSGCPWELPSPSEEGRAFRQIWLQMSRTVIRQALATAWFRIWLIILLGGGLWLGLFWIFAEGFQFLETAIPYSDLVEQIIRYVFGTFFMALMLMLVISAAILLFGGLFRSPDTLFLLTQPVRTERLFASRLFDTVLLSSWAFVILSSPLLLGFALVEEAHLLFYLLMLPYLVAFVYIPCCVGALFCLMLAQYVPRLKSIFIAAAIGAMVILGLLFLNWISWLPRGDAVTVEWLQSMLNRLNITQFRLLPSWWLTTGLMSAARGNVVDAVMFLMVIAANAVALHTLCVVIAGKYYRRVFFRLAELGRKKRNARTGLIDDILLHHVPRLAPATRQLIVKDIRLFRRDPVQWSQLLIFVGLLVFYFINIRRVYYEQFYFAWMNLVSFLNVAVVALLLSTFTTRFIFPLISLEGPRFWVLGLMPISRRAIIWSKVAFALFLCLVPCCGLVLLSDLMLGVDIMVHLAHQSTTVLCCVGLTAIAVGLGARYPNFRAVSAARIASGFGGTLNLVISTAFIIAVITLGSLPAHIRILAESPGLLPTVTAHVEFSPLVVLWFKWGPLAAIACTALFGGVSLLIGLRHFARIEF
jgi:ABC-2 type transport system permease protein